MQEIEIWQYCLVVYAQTRIIHAEWDAQNSLEFWNTNRSHNPAETIWPRDSKQKKKKRRKHSDWWTLPFRSPQNKNQRKRKERQIYIGRELKTRWNMKVIMISIVIGALGTIPKSLVKGLEELEIGERENK